MQVHLDEKEYAEKISLSLWKRLFSLAYPYRYLMLQLGLADVVLGLGETVFPLLTRYAIDHFIGQNTLSGLVPFVCLSVFLAALLSFCVWLFIKQAGRIEQSISYDVRKQSFHRLQQLSFSYYDRTPVGYIMARMTSDTARLSETIAWSLVDVLWAFARMAGALIAMFSLSSRITVYVLLVIPPLAAATIYFQRKIFKSQRQVRKANSRITGALNESIMGAATTKSLVREAQNLEEFSSLSSHMRKVSRKAAHLNAAYLPLVMLLGSIGGALALWRGGILQQQGLVWFGTISAFASYSLQFFDPLQQLARIFGEMQMAQASAERVFTLLDTQPDIVDTPDALQKEGDVFAPHTKGWPSIQGEIVFDHVSFSYGDGPEVLHDFSVHIKAGQTVALVGQTGSGKSTIVNLLCRFYEPSKGRILLDGTDIRTHSQAFLQSHLGYVLQSPHLFSGTVADNIRYGNPAASLEQVQWAAKQVSADEFIRALPEGYQTQVGEGGNRLSTGQKQLISFARALLPNPPLFVLDEATSSIDTETELLIQNAIEKTFTGRTAFVIAHRLSTIRHADLILVMKDGKMIEHGTHDQLMSQNGYYKRLYRNQFVQDSQADLLSGR